MGAQTDGRLDVTLRVRCDACGQYARKKRKRVHWEVAPEDAQVEVVDVLASKLHDEGWRGDPWHGDWYCPECAD